MHVELVLVIIIFIALFIILLIYLNITINIKFNNKEKDNSIIKISFSLFKNIKIFEFKDNISNIDGEKKVDNSEIMNVITKKENIEKYIWEKIQEYKLNDKDVKYLLKKYTIIEKLNVGIEIGTGEMLTTVYAVPAISTAISFMIGSKIRYFNPDNIYYNVKPNFNKQTFIVDVDCIVLTKLGNIIVIMINKFVDNFRKYLLNNIKNK